VVKPSLLLTISWILVLSTIVVFLVTYGSR
jgi:hypothetical protein